MIGTGELVQGVVLHHSIICLHRERALGKASTKNIILGQRMRYALPKKKKGLNSNALKIENEEQKETKILYIQIFFLEKNKSETKRWKNKLKQNIS